MFGPSLALCTIFSYSISDPEQISELIPVYLFPGAVHLSPSPACSAGTTGTVPMQTMMNTMKKNKELYFPAVYQEETEEREPSTLASAHM